MEEKLPPACAFAISVLAEYKNDPDTVPEEAIEAAQEHTATCPRCKETSHTSTTATTPPKRKDRGRLQVRAMVNSQLHQPLSKMPLPLQT